MTMPAQPRAATASSAEAPVSMDLTAVLARLGPELVQPLQTALDRLKSLQAGCDGDIAAALASLREPLRRARDGAVVAHQIGRLAAGRVRPAQDRLALNLALEQISSQRRREAAIRGLQLRVNLHAAEVQGDSALLGSLLNNLLDWALAHTRSSIDLDLSLTPWPVRARLRCRFAVRDLDQLHQTQPQESFTQQGLNWLLVQHTAVLMGVDIRREDESGVCVAQLDFPVPRLHEVLEQLDLGQAPVDRGHNTQPFAGWQVLVVSAREPLQSAVRNALEPIGWALESVDSIDAAFQFCLERLPQAIVVDGLLHGPDLEQFSCHVRADAPRFAFIELVPPQTPALQGIVGISLCREDQLSQQLPLLLRRALTPASQELTLRL